MPVDNIDKKMKDVTIVGLQSPVQISEDGELVVYEGKTMHQSTLWNKKKNNANKQVCIKNIKIYVHKLVAMAFVANPRPVAFKKVYHLDGNSQNNHFENLKWGNNTEIHKHMRETGKLASMSNPLNRNNSTISYEEALKIAKRLDNGERATDISVEYGVSEMSITRIRKRYCNKKNASPRYSKEIIETTLKLLQTHSPTTVSKITGIRYETIWRWNKKQKS